MAVLSRRRKSPLAYLPDHHTHEPITDGSIEVNILVLNPGSATLKFGLYQMLDLSKASATTDSATPLANGIVEPIGAPQAKLRMSVATQKPMTEPVEATTPVQAVEEIIRRLLTFFDDDTKSPTAIDAVGCRVVHGGPSLVKPTRHSFCA